MRKRQEVAEYGGKRPQKGEGTKGAQESKNAGFPWENPRKPAKIGRGAGRIRTGDGGFAIRCPSPENAGKTPLSENAGADAGAVETKNAHDEAGLQAPQQPTIDDVIATVEACPALPEAIKAGILAMINAAR